MITVKRQYLQLGLSVLTFVFVIGSLSMVWPTIFAIFFGAILLLQSCCLEELSAMLSWAAIGHIPNATSLL